MSAKKTFSPDMVANNITPAYPTHPGEELKDEIEFRGISQRQTWELRILPLMKS